MADVRRDSGHRPDEAGFSGAARQRSCDGLNAKNMEENKELNSPLTPDSSSIEETFKEGGYGW